MPPMAKAGAPSLCLAKCTPSKGETYPYFFEQILVLFKKLPYICSSIPQSAVLLSVGTTRPALICTDTT